MSSVPIDSPPDLPSDDAAFVPIAIVGMACRLPGAPDLARYWRLIEEGQDAISEIPPERWPADAYYDPQPGVAGKMCTRWGGFIEQLDQFDVELFKIAPREARWIDPQQRLILELGWRALEDALIAPDSLAGSATGVFVGISTDDYGVCLLRDYQKLNEYTGTGGCGSIAANRLSYVLDLKGPSVALDTACSSSLTGVHLACQSLSSGESNLAICGGVNAILTPDKAIAYSQSQLMAPDGRCKPFDEAANGFVRGEGCGMMVLKRLSDADRDRDPIRAVILGSAVNQDGRSNGLTAPHPESQRRVIESALRVSGLNPSEIGYLEAHGTGTPLGDPIEIRALTSVLSKGREPGNRCVIGSVKANIGHLEAAAGMASLIKGVLALEKKRFPRQIHFRQLNPRIRLDPARFEIPTASQDWESEGRRRIVGANGFGFGGANAHVLLGEYPSGEEDRGQLEEGAGRAHCLNLCAQSLEGLKALAGDYRNFLKPVAPTELGGVCASAISGRAKLAWRASVVGDSVAQIRSGLESISEGRSGPHVAVGKVSRRRSNLGMLFTGQGSQRSGMGRELYQTESCFREWIERGQESLRRFVPGDGGCVFDPEQAIDASKLQRTDWAQPALFILEVALYEQCLAWDVKPVAVFGHSIGEYAAAYAAGVFSFEDALCLVEARGRLTQQLPSGGGMAVVSAEAARVSSVLETGDGNLGIAAINAPNQIVISGDEKALETAVARLQGEGIRVRTMAVAHAFHSPLMNPMLDAFEAVARRVNYHRPSIPLISNLTGDAVGDELLDAGYWRRHVLGTVQFVQGLDAMAALGCDTYLELGPQPTLSALGKRCPGGDAAVWCSTLKADGLDRKNMLVALGVLDTRCGVDWSTVYPIGNFPKLRLPGYVFQRKRFWFDDTGSPERSIDSSRLQAQEREVPFPGRRVLNAGRDETRFEFGVQREMPRYFFGHRVRGASVFPAAGWIVAALTLQTVAEPSQEGVVVARDVRILRPLALLDEGDTMVQSVLQSGEFSGYSREKGEVSEDASEWVQHVSGKIDYRLSMESDVNSVVDVPAIRAACSEKLEPASFYERLAGQGLDYGPEFQVVTTVRRGTDQVFGTVKGPVDWCAGDQIHPATLDGAWQLLGALDSFGSSDELLLPVSVGELLVRGPVPREIGVHLRLDRSASDASAYRVDLDLLDGDGSVIVRVIGLRLRRIPRDHAVLGDSERSIPGIYETTWEPKDLSMTANILPAATRLLVLAETSTLGQGLFAYLKGCGHDCEWINVGGADGDDASGAWALQASGWLDRSDRDASVCIVWLAASSGDLDSQPMLDPMGSSSRFLKGLHWLIGSEIACSLMLVTRGAQSVDVVADAVEPSQSALWGMVRCVGIEVPRIRCRCLDLDPMATLNDWESVGRELLSENDEAQLAIRRGQRLVARLQSLAVGDSDPEVHRLALRRVGDLESFHLKPVNRRVPNRDEVELEVMAAGLNFRDLLHGLGKLKDVAGGYGVSSIEDTPFGFECAGRVLRVGTGVTQFRSGDAVLALAKGCMGSHVVVNQKMIGKMPSEWRWEEAAALPVAFMTAWHALIHLAELKAGEFVLIHSIAGGVGQAALQIVKWLGAIPIGTASRGKQAFVRSKGLEIVADSRDPSFVKVVQEATLGRGVAVVLNSLSGAMLNPTVSCLEPKGRFVEIGKLGVLSEEAFRELRPDARYHVFDLAEESQCNPALIQKLYGELSEQIAQGFRPLPARSFRIGEASQAFRYLAQTRQMGKVILRTAGGAALRVKADASYLISGGWGALGLAMAEMLVEEGARSLILLGRSQPSAKAREVVDRFASEGVTVRLCSIDVGDAVALRLELDRVNQDMPMVRGVIHAAGVLRDRGIMETSVADMMGVARPKALGGWVLHEWSLGQSLDFFVMFSSVAATIGSPGQLAYAGANGFLDGLARYRVRRRLPVLSVSWGPWEGAGMASKLKRAVANGISKISVSSGQRLTAEWPGVLGAHVVAADVDWSRFDPPAGMRSFYEAVRTKKDSPGDSPLAGFRFELEQIPAADREARITRALQQEVSAMLGGERVETEVSLLNLGADSLLLMELSSRVERSLGIMIPEGDLSAESTIEDLSHLLCGLYRASLPKDQFRPGLSGSEADSQGAVESGSASVESLSTRRAQEDGSSASVPMVDFEAPVGRPSDDRRLAMFRRCSQVLWRLEAEGLEHLPSEGPVIFCSNHESHFDGLWIASVLPEERRRRLCILAKKEHFDHWLNRQFARLIGAIPIDRDAAAVEALAKGRAVLDQGRSLIIHPEGTRTRDGDLLPFRKGAAVLSLVTGVPLMPVYLSGAFQVFAAHHRWPSLFDWRKFGRHSLGVRFGKPLWGNPTSTDDGAGLTERLQKAVLDLRPDGQD
jgi:1-acyl-sn-glycerol-3-phosphate acyltransferase